jgi:long-chain fatty acid transport protein
MSFKKTKLAVAVATGLALSPAAFATNGIIQAGNGMVAHGLGGASLSNGTEAMAIFDNPALLSRTGESISMGFSVFMPDREVDNTILGAPASVVSDAKVFAIPQVAFTSKLNDSVSWGIAANAMGGMNTDYRTGSFGGGNPETVDLSGMLVNPSVSFAVNKNLSVGGALLIGYENFRVRNLFGSGLSNEGSTMAYGVKLGVDYKINDGMSVAAVLQPKMSAGEFDFFKNFLSAMGFTGDAELVLPNVAGVGGKFAVDKNVDIVADIMYYQWSGVDVFEFFGWDDQIVYKVGVEYRATDKLALRAGFNYGESPIQGGNRTGNGGMDAAFANYSFPAITETHITIGLGYKMDKNMTINAYYLHSPEASQTSTTTSFTPAPVPPGTEIKMTQNAFGLGFNYQSK